ncbi:multiple epidermal growth factor-like domains protein 9 [Hemicordylus capensis]|uniref:multiple epidermal growth factor-like domains protein 9 n=1 Tax=Hemicordylus capensis TaxID=884348 RepID=UPI002304BDFC|nr:multiple epidermal growth factor-like domains protein 9 [Hemicordylus capensis]
MAGRMDGGPLLRRAMSTARLGQLALLLLLLLLSSAGALALASQPRGAAAATGPPGPAAGGGGGSSSSSTATGAAAAAAAGFASPAPEGGKGPGEARLGDAAGTFASPSSPPPPPPTPRASPREEEEEKAAARDALGSWEASNATGPPLQPTSAPPAEPQGGATSPGPPGDAGAGSPTARPGGSSHSSSASPGVAPSPASPSAGALRPSSSSIPTTELPSAPAEEEEDPLVHSGTDFFCNCSSAGSTAVDACNTTTGQCECRQGYTGQLCDGCEEGYYPDPSSGRCRACGCYSEGSVSLFCDNSGRCQCKAGATGPKCTQCQGGYSRFNKTTCEPCRCNNHSKNCDHDTGTCLDCQGNTEGPYCERCREHHYWNGSRHECVLCPCSTKSSTGNCRIKPGHRTPTCDQCKPGYTGIDCAQCSDGYYSSDSICVKCQCNGNVDPAKSPQVCKPDTGECLGCLYHTAGPRCERCQEGYARQSEGGNCTKPEYVPDPGSRGLTPSATKPSKPTSLPTAAANSTQTTVQTPFSVSPSDNSTSTLADVSWTQFNIIILTVIIILVVLLMGFVGAVYMYREYQNRKLNAPFWTIELKEDNISFSSYHDSIPNADVSGLLEDDGNEVAPNGQLALATPMHNYKA